MTGKEAEDLYIAFAKLTILIRDALASITTHKEQGHAGRIGEEK